MHLSAYLCILCVDYESTYAFANKALRHHAIILSTTTVWPSRPGGILERCRSATACGQRHFGSAAGGARQIARATIGRIDFAIAMTLLKLFEIAKNVHSSCASMV